MPAQPPAPGSRVKLLLVEDSPRLQTVLTNVLGEFPGVELVGVVDTATDALASFELHQPQVVVLDLVLREGNGLDVLQRIKQRRPACRVWIFTNSDGEPYRRRCRTLGADAFFSKHRQHQQLIEHMRDLVRAAPSVRPRPDSRSPMPAPSNA
jgi:DNA-binding NarL/FixJ family response regulator